MGLLARAGCERALLATLGPPYGRGEISKVERVCATEKTSALGSNYGDDDDGVHIFG